MQKLQDLVFNPSSKIRKKDEKKQKEYREHEECNIDTPCFVSA